MFFRGPPFLSQRTGSDISPDEELHAVFMTTARMQFQRMAELLGDEEIHHGQGMILGTLKHFSCMSPKELSAVLKRRPPTITVMLSRMEKSGLIRKEPDESDQRVTRITLTDKGLELTHHVGKQLATITEQCFEGFSQEDKDDLKRLLLKMSDNLGDNRKEPPLC